MNDKLSLLGKITHLNVSSLQKPCGQLIFEKGSYSFIYNNPQSKLASVTMLPEQKLIYQSGALFPIFEMNIPEGFVRHYIIERLRRYADFVNDMTFLALQQDTGIGALNYQGDIQFDKPQSENLNNLLNWDENQNVFQYLIDKYLFNTSISGVQPKVMFSANTKSSLIYPNLIAKTGDEEYPNLPENEYICMSLAKACGLPTPNFYLSNNKQLFIMERFDIQDDIRLAMEDFCVLMNKRSQQKYQGSYEMGAKVVNLYTQKYDDLLLYWQYVVFSCMVGNGDAHLKNFALIYSVNQIDNLTLSPLYDVVNTQIYPTTDGRLALKLQKSNEFPNRDKLLAFAAEIGISNASVYIEKMADTISDILSKTDLCASLPELKASINQCVSRASATNQVFVKFDVKRQKNRKTDKL